MHLSGNSTALCPVRPPQTAIGRTAGTLLGSAPVPVAVFGVARPLPLISAIFNAKAQRRKDAKSFWFSLRPGVFASWRLITSPAKAPEGWRTPRRFARFGGQRSTRQRLGLRWPSTAFPSRTKPAHKFKHPLPRSSPKLPLAVTLISRGVASSFTSRRARLRWLWSLRANRVSPWYQSGPQFCRRARSGIW